MSNNIHDTNVDLIRKQVNDLIEESRHILKNGEQISDYENQFSFTYKYLINTSKTLYKYICNQMQNYNNKQFDEDAFKQKLDMMLNAILNIQKSNITQYDASVMIGEKLASDYIPQYSKSDC